MFKYFVIMIILLNTVNTSYSETQTPDILDSLLNQLPNAENDTNKVNLLIKISSEFSTVNPDKGIKYIKQAIELSKELNWLKGEADSYFEYAKIYANILTNYPNSLEQYRNALNIYRQINDTNGIGVTLTSKGTILAKQAYYSKALECFFEALKIYKNKNDRIGIAYNYANIGNVYHSQIGLDSSKGKSLIVQSLKYYSQAASILENLGHKEGEAHIYTNIASIYFNNYDFLNSMEFYDKSLQIYESINSQYGKAVSYGNMANLFVELKQYSKAFDYYQKALKLNEEIGNQDDLANNYANLGLLYSIVTIDSVRKTFTKLPSFMFPDLNTNFEKALYHLNYGIAIFEELGNKQSQIFFLNEISELYARMGNFKAALETYKKYTKIKDYINSEEKNIKIASLEANYQNELKDNEIKLLNSKQEKRKLELYLSLGGITFLIAALLVAFIRYRAKKKLSDDLMMKNKIIEEQKSIVEEQNEHIYSSIHYASTIQHAILPWEEKIRKVFPNNFIFFKPKDIVSGDSYWFQEIDGIKFFAVIDCTGHGIPGAMLTVIAASSLDDAILGKRFTDTGKILTYMNEKVTDVLNKKLAENNIRDGMEIALIAIHSDKIQFSGAGRPLYVKNDSFEIIKTDKRGIASQKDYVEYKFSSVEIKKTNNMMLYLSTDGFADQMNEHSKKYSTKRFAALLETISVKPVSEQIIILEDEFNSHKGTRSQIDDVTVIGVRL